MSEKKTFRKDAYGEVAQTTSSASVAFFKEFIGLIKWGVNYIKQKKQNSKSNNK